MLLNWEQVQEELEKKQLALVEIEGMLNQQTGLEMPQVSGLQEGGRRLLSRLFHRGIKINRWQVPPLQGILEIQYFGKCKRLPKTLIERVGHKSILKLFFFFKTR